VFDKTTQYKTILMTSRDDWNMSAFRAMQTLRRLPVLREKHVNFLTV